MSQGQSLLDKVAALREHLKEAAELAGSATKQGDAGQRLRKLESQIRAGEQQTVLLDATLRQLGDEGPAADICVFPTQLTSRARRIVERGQDHLSLLRNLAERMDYFSDEESSLLKTRYQDALSMTEVALRLVQVFPDAASVQLRLCAGVEAIQEEVGSRLRLLSEIVSQRTHEANAIEALARMLEALASGQAFAYQDLAPLAEEPIDQAAHAEPMQFSTAEQAPPARAIAARSLTRARVVARMIRQDGELQKNPIPAVVAALLLDVGMLYLPEELLTQIEPLQDEQRRQLERHARIGAELVAKVSGDTTALAEAISQHHERVDGTGYPGGLRGEKLSNLAKLLAVADNYAALGSPRVYRAALDTRTALAEVLFLTQQNKLDKAYAEQLMQLSFYPVGTTVELADGSTALVIATHMGRRSVTTPARPVVAVLADAEGRPLSSPRYVDLAQCEEYSIVRSLSAERDKETRRQGDKETGRVEASHCAERDKETRRQGDKERRSVA